ncbi:heterokaryon incompatibility Het-C [Fistulina hepatica ATCC 64428]|uniref:Heterokaryon incompatibility Het-C n=1 Tax=Fistulina hepatica ATCC 64428 TaxID=1128425 RepID=A0A0D7AAU4_9AGAR|nr:heterokaryon incompatibility Het-C [Fistulina hepatica ATCC 64428]
MTSNNHQLLFYTTLFVVFCICISHHGVAAFGAGKYVEQFAYLEGKAFRHGDIEDVLSELSKSAGGVAVLTSFLGNKGGRKFSGLDVKRVYFGNWLRDYSQAVDIASLKKVPIQTIINLCMVLGFMAHGYATNEFEVTADRLGTYLPVEHIDNPKGYGQGEDPRKYHPKLRPPVEDIELEIDPRTGMKNYISNENGHWDTSTALVRRLIERCIHLGRQYKSTGNKADLYECYRLLGTALHTLEDFAAHSNFCELVLVSMGYTEVFVHVGDSVRVQAPDGKMVAPIVTGTFGSSDFLHSLLGEASDHLSEASVTDLNKELDKATTKARSSGRGLGSPNTLRELFTNIPGGVGGDMSRDLDHVERIRAGADGKRPEDMSPQELHSILWSVLSFRDSVMKKISMTIEKIPGLESLVEKIQDGISVFVFSTLEPFLKPLLKTSTASLQMVAGEVISSHDQYEVFDDSRASDPTHSFLSKDHFNLILNEAAGLVAKTVVVHAVKLITRAWDDTSMNVQHVISDILECLFHPDFHDRNSSIQREMLQCVRDWISKMDQSRQRSVIQRLTKQSVREHKNTRLGGEGGVAEETGTYAYAQGQHLQHDIQGYVQNIPVVGQASGLLGKLSNAAGVTTSSYIQTTPSIQTNPSPAYPSEPQVQLHHQHNQAHYNAPAHIGYAPSYELPPSFPNDGMPSFPGAPPGFTQTFPNVQPSLPDPPPGSFEFPGAPAYPGGPPPPHSHHHHHEHHEHRYGGGGGW